MREIKFRGWDEEQKKMIGWEFLSLGKGELLNLKGVMQFTGLLDKQGKEIYEGDILKGYACYEDGYEETIGQVLCKGDKYVLCAKNGNPFEYFNDGSHETYGLECWRYGDDDQEFEIIGNIYENPELIK
jgi:uncharacterized phage protein (TIGR01671 family)